MCGIAAIFSYAPDAPPVDEGELLAISKAMRRRGPDGDGSWLSRDRRIGLAHRRLAIIDLSKAAAQPMALDVAGAAGGSSKKRYRITYNGEIYNFRVLREELESRGHVFKNQSDTEVLLHLYQSYGPEMVTRLRGMYAFAIWDEERQGVFLARDPFGVKPLYYTDDGATLRAASQVKALVAGGKAGTGVDAAGHVGFFLLGYVPEPHTLYSDIRALEAGTTMWVDRGGHRRVRRFFDVSEILGTAGRGDALDLHESLADSVRHHLVGDVPVGVFLSSGIDSVVVTALASEIGAGPLETMTLGFEEFRGTNRDEAPLALEAAQAYDTRHTTKWVSGKDFRKDLEALLEAMDQPTIDGVNVYFVAKEASKMGFKVALSGLGGDEMFCGYDSFRQIPALVGALGHVPGLGLLGKGLRVVTAPLLRHMTSPKYAGLLEYGTSFEGAYLLRRGLFMPWELTQVLEPSLAEEGWRSLSPLIKLEKCHGAVSGSKRKVAALEMSFYMRNQLLRDADWAGMAHSLEIRVPLVDSVLFNALASGLGRSGGPGKQALAMAPSTPLPASIRNRSKTGFFVPVQEWIQYGAAAGPERGLRGWAKRVYGEAVKG
ncbi:MAG: asparagine synthase (glutamine-hydrolyzing) [Rhodospirillales bacterium]